MGHAEVLVRRRMFLDRPLDCPGNSSPQPECPEANRRRDEERPVRKGLGEVQSVKEKAASETPTFMAADAMGVCQQSVHFKTPGMYRDV